MEAARIVHESIIKLQTDLNVKIDIESISYARLMNHIKFLIIRLNTNEQLQMDISEFTKNKLSLFTCFICILSILLIHSGTRFPIQCKYNGIKDRCLTSTGITGDQKQILLRSFKINCSRSDIRTKCLHR